MLTATEKKLLDALTPRSLAEQVEIVTVEVIGSKKSPTIRVYIDCEGGISFDELASAQAWVNEIMDKIDPFPGAYTLEVSSPGIDRPLRTPEHFNRFAGDTAVIKVRERIDGKNSFKGEIVGADDAQVTLKTDEGEQAIPLANIKRANLKGIIDFSRKQ